MAKGRVGGYLSYTHVTSQQMRGGASFPIFMLPGSSLLCCPGEVQGWQKGLLCDTLQLLDMFLFVCLNIFIFYFLLWVSLQGWRADMKGQRDGEMSRTEVHDMRITKKSIKSFNNMSVFSLFVRKGLSCCYFHSVCFRLASLTDSRQFFCLCLLLFCRNARF